MLHSVMKSLGPLIIIYLSGHFIESNLFFYLNNKCLSIVMNFYNNDIEVTHKEDLSPLTKADLASNKIILESLSKSKFTVYM